MSLRVKRTFFATDANDNEVMIAAGDFVSEISDAGPVEVPHNCVGWNVTFRFTPKHQQWTEIVTVDAVKLLKALEG